MKHVLIIVWCLLIFSKTNAQALPGNFNLVANGGFEFSENDIIDTLNDLNSKCWFMVGQYSHQIFNTKKAIFNTFPVKVHGGHRVVSLNESFPDFDNNLGNFKWIDTIKNFERSRSYIGTKLRESLIAGRLYYFSMYVGAYRDTNVRSYLSENIIFANIGVHFSKTSIKQVPYGSRIILEPQLNFKKWNVPYNSELNFVRLKGSYQAVGGEEFITIGNYDFYNNYILINSPWAHFSGFIQSVYPLIDDISLVSDTTLPMISLENFTVGENRFLCKNQSIILQASPFFDGYYWNTGDTGRSITINKGGVYWCDASFQCGLIRDSVIVIEPNEINNISLGNDTSNCLYGFFLGTITLQIPANAENEIKWNTGSSSNFIKVQEPGAYWVQVSNDCYAVADTINISGCAAREVPKVDIPNAFTPNGDGKNDVFRLKYLPQQVVSFNLKIYNRYGQMISELKNRNDEWDGGEYELGVYYYLFIYKDITGKEYTQKGDISLVR